MYSEKKANREAWKLYLYRTPINRIKALFASLLGILPEVFDQLELNQLTNLLFSEIQGSPDSANGVNGEDDRMEYFEFDDDDSIPWGKFTNTHAYRRQILVSNTKLRDHIYHATKAVAAVMRKKVFEDIGTIEQKSLNDRIKSTFNKRDYKGRFTTQISAARGTAFLIRPHILLTAAHNLRDENGWICDDDLKYVFNFYNTSENTPNTEGMIAYDGKKLDYEMGISDDWILVKLTPKNPDPGIRHLALAETKNHPRGGMGLFSAGFPLGLPMKLTLVGQNMNRLTDDRFSVSLDMFRGNSGSPIISLQTGRVEGMLVSGFPDFVFEANSVRNRVYKFSDLAKDRAGERCQTIASIRERIDQVIESGQTIPCNSL